jgi:glycosyltransferase involved in cell wall biosynthesis
MKISVIIPVYNVEAFLERCLDSVQKQTYPDMEVVIVNDGSTDNSPAIIEKYVAQNEKFKSFTIENSGQGGARNFGVTKAEGEYIAFLDSDDYIAPDCIEKLAFAAKTENSDIVVCTSYNVKEDGTIIKRIDNNISCGTTSLFDSPKILFNQVAPWGKLFRKSIFGDLQFVTRVWYEDMRLIPKLYLNAERITYIEDPLFYYVQRAGSTMNNSNALRNLEIIEAFEDLIAYYKQKKVYDDFKAEFEFLILDHIAIATVTRVLLSNSAEKASVIGKIEEYVARFDNIYQNKYIPTLSSNKRFIAKLNKNKLYFLTALCMKIKNKIS